MKKVNEMSGTELLQAYDDMDWQTFAPSSAHKKVYDELRSELLYRMSVPVAPPAPQRGEQVASRPYQDGLLKRLADPIYAVEYLVACKAEGVDVLIQGLGDVAEAWKHVPNQSNREATQSGALSADAFQVPERYPWTLETMQIINKLTPEIKDKAFDPDWFLLRQRFEQFEKSAEGLCPEK